MSHNSENSQNKNASSNPNKENVIEYLFLRQETCKRGWQTLLNVDRSPVLIGTQRERRVKEAFERHDTSTPLITACQQSREPQPGRQGYRRVRTEQLVRTWACRGHRVSGGRSGPSVDTETE